jgi:hypothetical protein
MDDRRSLPRYPLSPRVLCRLSGPGLPEGALGVLVDVNARGAGLYSRHRPEPGSVLILEPAAGTPGLPRAITLQVRHVRDDPDDGFLFGGEFDLPLPEAELNTLLGNA